MSRAALVLLEMRNIPHKVVNYLVTPPSERELKSIIDKLGCGARGILRSKEPLYDELGLGDATLSDEALIKTMVAHPILIERPIVVNGRKAALGRPPENILAIL